MKVKITYTSRVIAGLLGILIFVFSCVNVNTYAYNSSLTYMSYNTSTNQRSQYTLNALTANNLARTAVQTPENRQPDDNTSVVQLNIFGAGSGTGFIIDNNLILTCAHVVFNKSNNSFFAEDYTFSIIIKDQNSNILRSLSSNTTKMKFHVPLKYYTATSSNEYDAYDYALIYVEEDLSEYGMFDVGVATDNFLNNNGSIITSGFPGYIDLGQTSGNGIRYKSEGTAYYHPSNSFSLSGELRFGTTSCNSAGNSGGPVYTITNYKNTNYYTAIGIVTGSTNNSQYYTGTSCVRITTNILQLAFNNSYVS